MPDRKLIAMFGNSSSSKGKKKEAAKRLAQSDNAPPPRDLFNRRIEYADDGG